MGLTSDILLTAMGESVVCPLLFCLTAALEDPNPEVFLAAVADVAKARGMTQLAKDTGLGRESLYKSLAPGAKPRYGTILKLLHGLGVKLHAEPVHS